MKLFGFCFHKWGKWSPPTSGIGVKLGSSNGYYQVYQLRVCDNCGKAALRKLSHVRSLEGAGSDA